MKSKDLFPKVFSRHALAYQERLEQVMARGEAPGRMRLLELVDARPGMHVLDLACGPGTLSRWLARQVSPGGEIVGVDLAAGMIDLARAAQIPNTRFEVMDMEQLSFPGASFDLAACGHGLQFAPNLSSALRETRRVLRPRARFAASVPVEGNKDSAWSILEAVIDRWLPPARQAADQASTRAAVADVHELEEATLAAGFTIARVEVVDETVRWESAEQLVSMFTSWWSCASRLDEVDADTRRTFTQEAVETLRHAYPGAIETIGRNHVLFAVA